LERTAKAGNARGHHQGETAFWLAWLCSSFLAKGHCQKPSQSKASVFARVLSSLPGANGVGTPTGDGALGFFTPWILQEMMSGTTSVLVSHTHHLCLCSEMDAQAGFLIAWILSSQPGVGHPSVNLVP